MVGKGVGADELGDALEGDLFLERLHEQVAVTLPVAVLLAPPVGHLDQILAVAVRPADGRIVPRVRQVAVQRPEAPDEAARVLRHRLREVAAGRRDRPNHRDRARAPVQRLHTARALVEARQTRRQIRREALVRRHLLQTARQLAQGLRPPRRRVRHHRHVIAHVAIVLGQRDTRVDGHLARRHRHVRRVRNQDGALHQRTPRPRILQLRELAQHLGHLVAALAAADVHDDVRVRPLRQRLLRHRLARAKPARYRRGAALRYREERIDHPQTRQQRTRQRLTLTHRTRTAQRPVREHRQLTTAAVRLLHHAQRLLARVLAGLNQRHYPTRDTRLHHHPVKHRQRLLDFAVHRPTAHLVAHLQQRLERPAPLHIQTLRLVAALQHRARRLGQALQRTLDAVVDGPQQPRAQAHGQRTPRAVHRLARMQAARVLVHLDCRQPLAANPDDLAYQTQLADLDHLEHPRALHVAGLDDRAVHPRDATHILSCLVVHTLT